ncbi:MAG: hypothetical protein EZS28_037325 [Streblomastix strix]|uniref:Uncharacterized protein n=1 Tax=Streblomastix strix TaxID=222440 RepID=A0A5J4U9U9_9EUKA|nr:MAG: hypothetical protein EZS28_037325 [Streblomastix strix]
MFKPGFALVGGKATLWDNPSLEQIQAHVEQIRSLPVVFPPEGEFEFINIYGSGYATAWHLILLAYQGLNKGDNKAYD